MGSIYELNNYNVIQISGLAKTVAEVDLLQLFGKVGKVLHLDLWRKNSLPRHASLIYGTEEEAKSAVEAYDYKVFQDKILRVTFPKADIRAHQNNTNGHAKVSITNVNMEKGKKYLQALFEKIGKVKDVKIYNVERAWDLPGVIMLGSGVVEFEKEEHAKLALEKLRHVSINSEVMCVDPYISERDKEEMEIEKLRRTVVVKNYSLDPCMVREIFEEIGSVRFAIREGSEYDESPPPEDEIPSERVYRITFEKIEEAALAVQTLNEFHDGKKYWSVKWALTKSELNEKMRKYEVLGNSQIVVKNLNKNVNDKHLREMFSSFGEVTSCKVELDSQDNSTRTGYVKFAYAKDATNAVNKMNEKMIIGKRLNVVFDEIKGQEKAKLQIGGGEYAWWLPEDANMGHAWLPEDAKMGHAWLPEDAKMGHAWLPGDAMMEH